MTNFATIEDIKISIDSMDESVQVVKSSLQEKKPLRVVTINPEILIAALQEPEFMSSIQKADLIVPDGIGVVFLLKFRGYSIHSRVPGIELAWNTLTLANQQKLNLALWGSSTESLKGASLKIKETFPNINLIFERDGFSDNDDEALNQIISANPDLLFLALPFTKQERMAAKLQTLGFRGVIFGLGGSFDVWAGNVQRAPKIFRTLHLEWFWRVLLQPQRLTRLSQILIPFFALFLKK
jgi:N-acetylglucosaminyldiphosphoundecaprenol N-acetyl-beta-D-mannosaminyltransferase